MKKASNFKQVLENNTSSPSDNSTTDRDIVEMNENNINSQLNFSPLAMDIPDNDYETLSEDEENEEDDESDISYSSSNSNSDDFITTPSDNNDVFMIPNMVADNEDLLRGEEEILGDDNNQEEEQRQSLPSFPPEEEEASSSALISKEQQPKIIDNDSNTLETIQSSSSMMAKTSSISSTHPPQHKSNTFVTETISSPRRQQQLTSTTFNNADDDAVVEPSSSSKFNDDSQKNEQRVKNLMGNKDIENIQVDVTNNVNNIIDQEKNNESSPLNKKINLKNNYEELPLYTSTQLKNKLSLDLTSGVEGGGDGSNNIETGFRMLPDGSGVMLQKKEAFTYQKISSDCVQAFQNGLLILRIKEYEKAYKDVSEIQSIQNLRALQITSSKLSKVLESCVSAENFKNRLKNISDQSCKWADARLLVAVSMHKQKKNNEEILVLQEKIKKLQKIQAEQNSCVKDSMISEKKIKERIEKPLYADMRVSNKQLQYIKQTYHEMNKNMTNNN